MKSRPAQNCGRDRRDEDSLPPYEVLDRILRDYVVEEKPPAAAGFLQRIPEDVVHDVLNKIVASEYKRRQAAPGLRVSPRAFGMGRRVPIAQSFRR